MVPRSLAGIPVMQQTSLQPSYYPSGAYAPQPRVPAGYGEYAMAPQALQQVEGVNMLAQMQADIRQLQMSGATKGGPVYAGLYEQGIPIYAHPEDVSKGGILQSAVGTLPIAAPAGTFAEISVIGEYLSRLTNTLWAFCAVALSGDLSDPVESGKCVVDASINGARVNTLYQTPLDTFAPNLFGTIFAVPVGRVVPPDAAVSFRVIVDTALTTTDVGNIRFRLYSGDESKWMHALGGGGR